MCCKEHHDCFKNQFCNEIEIMDPPMKTKLADIWKIINLIINSQKPDWVLSLFKLLLLDLSPCLTNFITIAVTKALIRKNKGKKKNEIIDMRLTSLNSIIVVNRPDRRTRGRHSPHQPDPQVRPSRGCPRPHDLHHHHRRNGKRQPEILRLPGQNLDRTEKEKLWLGLPLHWRKHRCS